MKRYVVYIIFLITVISLILISGEVVAEEEKKEEITLTTYYPAPYGEYADLYISENIFFPVEANNAATQFTIRNTVTDIDGIVSTGEYVPIVVYVKFPGASTISEITYAPGGYQVVGVMDDAMTMKNPEKGDLLSGYLICVRGQ